LKQTDHKARWRNCRNGPDAGTGHACHPLL